MGGVAHDSGVFATAQRRWDDQAPMVPLSMANAMSAQAVKAPSIDQVRICVTLTNHGPVSPFLSPRGWGEAGREPSLEPVDDSAEGMQRLRDPFAVDPTATPSTATAPAAPTDDEPSGHRQEREPGKRGVGSSARPARRSQRR